MPNKIFATGNSGTKISFDDKWHVVDIGSGHSPHPRADILVDKYLFDNTERSGAPVVLPSNKFFVVGDGGAMPFSDKVFDFVVCSHVLEHIEEVDNFCSELNRIASAGYLECPSKFSEILRHAPNHRWFVSSKRNTLVVSPAPSGYPLGWFGKLFFSLYFYNTRQVTGRDVYPFAHGVTGPFHFIFSFLRKALVKLWIVFKPLTYTRFYWKDEFTWEILK